MSVWSAIGLLTRFVRNPKPYLYVFPYKFWGSETAIRLYRRFILPRRVRKIKIKGKVNVVFLAMNPDMWKYDGVYRRMAGDKRFNPVIVTAMRNIADVGLRIQEQEAMVSCFKARGFNVVRGYNVESGKWIKLKKLRPDIIFHSQPYDQVIDHTLAFYNHLYALHCYSPYSFQLSDVEWNWNNTLQQYCWKIFYVSNAHLEQCKRISRIGIVNASAVGYSMEEDYAESIKDMTAANSTWRKDGRKRVIWAPHHSISANESFRVSSFLEIAELMVKLRSLYSKQIIWAFKPHPVLKSKLYNIWGRERTDAYYDGWAEADNSFDAQGDYKSLFAGSDAMIHCSGSFIVEYLYTGKPVAYVYSKTRNSPCLGPIGEAALNSHYPIHNEKDIRTFLDTVVLEGKDTMCDIRRKVADKYLKSPNGKMFSENVYKSIVDGLEL